MAYILLAAHGPSRRSCFATKAAAQKVSTEPVGDARGGRDMLSAMETCVFCEIVSEQRDVGVIAYQDAGSWYFPHAISGR